MGEKDNARTHIMRTKEAFMNRKSRDPVLPSPREYKETKWIARELRENVGGINITRGNSEWDPSPPYIYALFDTPLSPPPSASARDLDDGGAHRLFAR